MRANLTKDGRGRRAELRTAVLTLGGLLGWSSGEVITFAEAVTNRPWRQCRCADFERVVEEYWAIGRVIQETRAQHHREPLRVDQEGEHHVAPR